MYDAVIISDQTRKKKNTQFKSTIPKIIKIAGIGTTIN